MRGVVVRAALDGELVLVRLPALLRICARCLCGAHPRCWAAGNLGQAFDRGRGLGLWR